MQVITPLSFKEQACVIDMYSFLFHESLQRTPDHAAVAQGTGWVIYIYSFLFHRNSTYSQHLLRILENGGCGHPLFISFNEYLISRYSSGNIVWKMNNTC